MGWMYENPFFSLSVLFSLLAHFSWREAELAHTDQSRESAITV
jgi:hypothetical protein